MFVSECFEKSAMPRDDAARISDIIEAATNPLRPLRGRSRFEI